MPEAQQLISSLNKFVTALVRPKAETSALKIKPQRERCVHNFPTSLTLCTTADSKKEKKPRLLQLALDTMYQRIYNNMPIRLLAFNADGSGIKLIERGEIWQRLSSDIEKDFSEEGFKTYIHRIETANHTKGGNAKKEASDTPEKLAIHAFLARHGRYAILSHTWLQGTAAEVTYDSWKDGTAVLDSSGYRKLANFCRVAATQYNVSLGWMDTICIDKSSSSELDESIRSMFKWYRYSHECITYLANTTDIHNMRKDAWFTRGWTLQELLAPTSIKFYNADWNQLAPGIVNDKANDTILDVIRDAADITKKELTEQLWTVPISRRMQWAASRQVTRAEDIAYSLMGIFGVSISIAYGEGSEQAFFRLAQGILNTNTLNLLDIMNWGYGYDFPKPSTIAHTSTLIPPGPQQYTWRALIDIRWFRPTKPITLTHLGLHVPVLLMPGMPMDVNLKKAVNAVGSYHATITNVDLLYPNSDTSRKNYAVLDRSAFEQPRGQLGRLQSVVTFGVMNFSETSTAVNLPVRGECFAVPFQITPPPTRGVIPEEITANRIAIKRAIVFDLKQLGTTSFTVPKSELHRHGITLRTMYL